MEDEGLIEQLFPIHEKEPLKALGSDWCTRVLRGQPLGEIRHYFGETIAMYFAFLNFYTLALVVPGILSFLYILLGSSAGLKSFVFFCVFNILAASVLLEVWKRRQAGLAFQWGTFGLCSQLEETRPAYRGTRMTCNPVTDRPEPYFSKRQRLLRFYCISVPIVACCLVFAIVVMRFYFSIEFAMQDYLHDKTPGIVRTILLSVPSIAYAIVIVVMNGFYRRLAKGLNDFENHRLASSYTNHLVVKLLLFDFVNSFLSLFYTAFVLRDLIALRSALATLLIVQQIIGQFQEVFLPYLSVKIRKKVARKQLDKVRTSASTSSSPDTVSQAANGDTQSVLRKDASGAGDAVKSSDMPELDEFPGADGLDDPETHVQALIETQKDEYMEPLDDYLELFLQFGYVFMFSAVFPPAALCALINNITELRADAFKLVHNCQRPFAKPCANIGVWQSAFEALTILAVVCNSALLALSKHADPWRASFGDVTFILIIIGVEHALFGMKLLVSVMIPDVPQWVSIAVARVQFQAQQALYSQTLQDASSR